MGSKKTREIEEALLSKGFMKEDKKHKMFFLYYGDKRTSIYAMTSHGIKEYGENLLAKMAREIKLNRNELDDLIECPLQKDDFIEKLKKDGHIK